MTLVRTGRLFGHVRLLQLGGTLTSFFDTGPTFMLLGKKWKSCTPAAVGNENNTGLPSDILSKY